jgi:hypothetical protein
MHHIRTELDRIETALRDPQTDERYCQLYAAQQALAWAMNPSGFKSLFETIQRGLVRPFRDTQEDEVGCPSQNYLPRSLEILSRTG